MLVVAVKQGLVELLLLNTNFILQDNIEPSICDDLIKFYNGFETKNIGKSTKDSIVNLNIKSCEEVYLSLNYINVPIIKKYLDALQVVCNKYIETYEYCVKGSRFDIVEQFNIQHYKPQEAYFSFHCERSTKEQPFSSRHLVWMTYLNDVDDAGETEFYYQELKIKPQKGKTVIFPADWTHTHRGIASPSQDKYIITGWYNFIE
jgi:hypothetical protein